MAVDATRKNREPRRLRRVRVHPQVSNIGAARCPTPTSSASTSAPVKTLIVRLSNRKIQRGQADYLVHVPLPRVGGCHSTTNPSSRVAPITMLTRSPTFTYSPLFEKTIQ